MRTIQHLIDQEIFTNQDSLITELLAKDIFSIEDIYNLYPKKDDYDTDEDFDDLDCDDVDAREIMQWFSVSEWLGDKLKEIGAPILGNEYGTWWGRCEYGNGLENDSALNAVCALIHKQAAA